ncbi:actin-like ATPase domain-containing protein [Backusella circina FSU 941]|nr:actin-like ATPase domain-containing protein [Backusella circina FSU 941]
MEKNSEYDFLIAIDFGPLYCTCSFVSLQGDKQTIYDVNSWPKQKRSDNNRVPTVITYPGIGDSNVPPLFGFAGEEARLFRKKVLACHISPDEINKPLGDKNPTAEYLFYFHEHVKKYLADTQMPPFHLTSRARYCFTMQYKREGYKENLQLALKTSGIIGETDREDKTIFVDKYIAISSYILETNNDLRESDEFLICDVGEHLLTIKRMKINGGEKHKNIVEIDLDKSINRIEIASLDTSFEDFIGPKLKDMAKDLDPSINYDTNNAIQVSAQYFSRSLKKSLQHNDTGEYYLNLPLVTTSKHIPDQIPVTAEELKSQVFEPVIKAILQKIIDVIGNNHPKRVYLYGDFGNLDFLKYEVSKVFSETKIIQENNTAASRGAIHYGMHMPLTKERVPPRTDIKEKKVGEDRSYYDFNYDHYAYVVGIDFGTSNTKWYYAPQNEKNTIEFDFSKMFIPSLSLYDEKLDGQLEWGTEAYKTYYESVDEGRLITRFKLMLDEDSLPADQQVTAIEAISTYLNVLHQKILTEMTGITEKKKIRYCLTIPTIWSDSSKSVMRQAAILAGIIDTSDHPSRLMLVNEPEAAAIFYSQDKKLKEIYKAKSRVLVIDAGGGTVDMAVYDFEKRKDTYDINEVTIGTGKICGSSFLDDNFRELIREKCFAIDYIAQPYTIEKMVDYFVQKIKTKFTSSTESEYHIPINHTKGKPPKEEYLRVSPLELQEKVFDSIVNEVLFLVEEQIESLNQKKGLDLIILTGGLSQSMYLQEKLQLLADAAGIPKVHSPEKYDQSVVRGAVALALDPSTITKRISKRSYGIEALLLFDPRRDPIINRIKQTDNDHYYCKQKFDLFSKIGTSIKTYEYIQQTYSIPYQKNTYIALYGHSTEDDINLVTDNRAKNVFFFNIEMPKIEGAQENKDMIDLVVQLYLGQTEIKVDSIIGGQTTRHTFVFGAIDESAKMELEALHKKSLKQEQFNEKTTNSKKSNSNPKKGLFKFLSSLGRNS